MPATARGWGVNPMDPEAALDAAAKNMRQYVDRYGGYENALRAYNAGPAAIERSKGFSETNNYVRTILGGRTPARPTSRPSRSEPDTGDDAPRTRTITETTPGVDNRVARANLIMSFLSKKGFDPLEFATQATALRDVAPTSTSREVQIPGRPGGSSGGQPASDLAASATRRADIINQQRLPYQWGGGHGGQTKIRDAVPLDCSGAVSKVLGIDPRVSGNFQKWGRAGDGGNKGVTVYANPTHVLMKINGHFFGTSQSNPGGGAGWIPADQVSDEYLSKFTVRHSAR